MWNFAIFTSQLYFLNIKFVEFLKSYNLNYLILKFAFGICEKNE